VTIVSVTAASGGTVAIAGTQLRYTPRANYSGSDVFLYTVRDVDGQQSMGSVFVTITPVNDAPIARPDSFSVVAGVETTLQVLQNDTDPDGNGLTLVSVSTPLFGTARVVGNAVAFLAPLGALGQSTFTYEVSDGRGGLATGTVTLDVRP
jgi:hypothetical protein